MFDLHNADELRQWAASCAEKAERAVGVRAEHERLVTMRDALLALAETADWLDGRSRDSGQQQAA
jgi:hypothetical protein